MNALILIDKPEGRTSRQVVEIVQKKLAATKAGHVGTLDPLATGLLVVCLNEATKLSAFLVQDTKEYELTMMLGVRTDTWDREGKVEAQQTPEVEEERLRQVLARFRGRITQTVPAYSAVKHQGKPLYKWARRGEKVAAPRREVEIYDLELRTCQLPYVSLRVLCSKGTYMRSLCHEIGEILGCGAAMWSLRRTKSGIFSLDQAIALDRLDAADFAREKEQWLISLNDALPAMPEVEIGSQAAWHLSLGRQPKVEDLLNNHMPLFARGDVVKLVTADGRLRALAQTLWGSEELSALAPELQGAKILRVFNAC